MPHDSLCNEGFKNVYLVGVRNVEGQNTYGHTVWWDIRYMYDTRKHMLCKYFLSCNDICD